MHPIGEIAPHQAVASPAVDVETPAARDRDTRLIGVGVEEALEEGLPAWELVQFVEQHDRRFLGQAVEVQSIGQASRSREDRLAVVEVVPVDVGIGPEATGGGLADLPGTAEERHLSMARQVFGEDGVIDALRGHATIF